MNNNYNIDAIDDKIKELRKVAEELNKLGQDIEAVKRNVVRIFASTKMLEINISDVRGIL
jgi:hypothetical protein